MQRALTKYWKTSLAIVVIVTILFMWIPVAWYGDLQFDKTEVATDYYKTLIDIGKILLAFWLVNVVLDRIRKSEVMDDYQGQWCDESRALLEAIRSLLTIEEVREIAIVDEWKRTIETSSSKLDYLAEILSRAMLEHNLGPFGFSVYEYKYRLRPHIGAILEGFREGRIVPLRTLEETYAQSVQSLMQYLNNFLGEGG